MTKIACCAHGIGFDPAPLVVSLCLLLGAAVSSADAEETVELTVSGGDTLSGLALQHLDRPSRWGDVARFNRLDNPHLIFPGQRLVVPVRYLKGAPVEAMATLVKGDTQVRTRDDDAWRPLAGGDRVAQGSTIRTAGEGSAEVAYPDDTRILLRPDTQVRISTSEQKGDASLVRRFFLTVGRIITDLRKATGAASRYEITTPSATATARGTDFRVSVDAAGTTRTEVLQGGVEVAAKRKAVSLSAGQGTTVRKGEIPGAAGDLLPPPAPRDFRPVYKSLPLRFLFDSVAGAQSYRVTVSRDTVERDVVAERIISPGGVFELPRVEDGTYFLAAHSIDVRGLEGDRFTPRQFIFRTNPGPPIIQAPPRGAELRGRGVDIRWLNVGGASGYRLQLGRDRDFGVLLADRPGLTESMHREEGLESGAYYFRVCSIASDGFESEWSDAQPFSLTALPAAPGLEQAAVGDENIHLAWKDMGPGLTYHYQVARDEAFGSILADARAVKPETAVPRPHEAGTYFVRVSSIDASGYEGEFSPAQSFEVARRFPYGIAGGVIALLGLIFLIAP